MTREYPEHENMEPPDDIERKIQSGVIDRDMARITEDLGKITYKISQLQVRQEELMTEYRSLAKRRRELDG